MAARKSTSPVKGSQLFASALSISREEVYPTRAAALRAAARHHRALLREDARGLSSDAARRLRSRLGDERADDLHELLAQLGVDEVVALEAGRRMPDRDAALEDAGAHRAEHLPQLGLRPHGAECACARADDR